MLKSLPQKAQDSLIKQVCFPKRLGFPEEFGRICGDIIENSYINGECIRLVCGGVPHCKSTVVLPPLRPFPSPPTFLSTGCIHSHGRHVIRWHACRCAVNNKWFLSQSFPRPHLHHQRQLLLSVSFAYPFHAFSSLWDRQNGGWLGEAAEDAFHNERKVHHLTG